MFKMVRFVLTLLCSAFVAMNAHADWPSKTIRVVVPTPAGSSVDIVARLVADKLGPMLGQSVIVDNKPGAGGVIGVAAVVNAHDGHTFLLGYNGPLTVAPSLAPKPPYDPARDLTPIILAVTQPNVLAVRSDLNVNSVKQLIALAKSRPGMLDYASVGVGSLSNIQPLIKTGKIKLLAVSNARRSVALPDLPTLAEAGFPGFDATTWNGFLAPANTPVEVVQRLNKAIAQILALPDVQQRLLVAGAETAGGSAEQFGQLLKRETAAWAAVIERSGVKLD